MLSHTKETAVKDGLVRVVDIFPWAIAAQPYSPSCFFLRLQTIQ